MSPNISLQNGELVIILTKKQEQNKLNKTETYILIITKEMGNKKDSNKKGAKVLA